VSTVHQHKSALGGAVKAGNQALAAQQRALLKEATAEQYIRRLVDSAPTLAPDVRDRLAVLLRGDVT